MSPHLSPGRVPVSCIHLHQTGCSVSFKTPLGVFSLTHISPRGSSVLLNSPRGCRTCWRQRSSSQPPRPETSFQFIFIYSFVSCSESVTSDTGIHGNCPGHFNGLSSCSALHAMVPSYTFETSCSCTCVWGHVQLCGKSDCSRPMMGSNYSTFS